jgi:uncharacterized membrane protein YfcA
MHANVCYQNRASVQLIAPCWPQNIRLFTFRDTFLSPLWQNAFGHFLMTAFPDLQTTLVILIAGVFGGIVRGYSGFGFALAAMPILTMAVSPVIAVPAVFPLECLIGLLTLPRERVNVDVRVLKWLALGAIIGTPLGIGVLSLVPANPMRLVVALAVAAATFRAWRGQREAMAKTPINLASIGFLSGCLNGGTAMSGPPVIVSLLGSNMPLIGARATLIAFIAMSAGFGIVLSAANGAYSLSVARISLVMAPAAAMGCALGVLAFSQGPRHHYRSISLSLLAFAMAIAIVTASFSLINPH